MSAISKLAKLANPEIRAKNYVEIARAARGAFWALTRPSVPDPLFVVGCSRSGTTITYETLVASGHFLSFGYEIPQFWDQLYGPHTNGWESEAATAANARPEHRDSALRFFYQRLGRGLVLDKTCINAMRVGYLHALFPQARFVFICRDGRDNVSSMIDGWKHGRTDGGFGLAKFLGVFPEQVAIHDGAFREWHFFIPPGWRNYNHAPLEDVCAYQWITCNRLALDAAAQLPGSQWIAIRYEDLVERPVETFRDVFERLGLPFDTSLREHCAGIANRPTSIVKGGPKKLKWKEHNPDAIERILPMIRPMMLRLGYE